MSCHRFDPVRCRKPARFPVTSKLCTQLVIFLSGTAFQTAFSMAAASSRLTIPDAAGCAPSRNCAGSLHSLRNRPPGSSWTACFFCSFVKLSLLPAHFAKYLFCEQSGLAKASLILNTLTLLSVYMLLLRHLPPAYGPAAFPYSRMYLTSCIYIWNADIPAAHIFSSYAIHAAASPINNKLSHIQAAPGYFYFPAPAPFTGLPRRRACTGKQDAPCRPGAHPAPQHLMACH